MVWGFSNQTSDETKNSIAQPPPTPGLAAWAFNSLFNKQTPSSKYAALSKPSNNYNNAKRYESEASTAENKDDTFYYRKRSNRQAYKGPFKDDILLNSSKKNVAWGGEDFKVRSRSSSFNEQNFDKNLFNKEKELLPDIDDDEFNFTNSRLHKRSNSLYDSSSRLNRFPTSGKNTSLPETFPGKFPSPFVPRDDSFNSNVLSSSASRNFRAADLNTEKNKNLNVLNSSSPIKAPEFFSRKPSKPKEIKKPYTAPQQQAKVPSSYTSRSSLYRNEPKIDSDYEPFVDETELLNYLNHNTSDLKNITRHVEHLKLHRDEQKSALLPQNYNDIELQKKYSELRQELVSELKKSKKLYDSYYRFVTKYKDLKQEHRLLLKNSDNTDKIAKLQKEIDYLQGENELLIKKIRHRDQKLVEDDNTVMSLKSTLMNSSNFEVTLKRKIKYLEDKIEQDRLELKKEKFQANEKIFLLEAKLKDQEEGHSSEVKLYKERIIELERKLELKNSFDSLNEGYRSKSRLQDPKLSIIPEYTLSSKNTRPKSVSNYDFNEENLDTLDIIDRVYPDREVKPSSTTRDYDNSSRVRSRPNVRPSSLQVGSEYRYSDYLKDDDAHRFDSNDSYKRTDLDRNEEGYKRPTSLRSSSNKDLRTYRNRDRYPDIDFNTSELS